MRTEKKLGMYLGVVFLSGLVLLAGTDGPARAGRFETGGGNFIASEPVDGVLSVPARSLPVSERLPGAGSPVTTDGLLLDFDGLSGDGFAPPDPVGDVGPGHYVQMVNESFAVFNKNGALLSGPNPFYQLFGASQPFCADGEEDGSPSVVYDSQADRWVLSKHSWSDSDLNILCVAVSQTGDPAGAFFLYQFTMPDFSDYPRLGVWPDAYYVGTNTGFPNLYFAHALDRTKMLSGLPATVQSFGEHPNFLMPADLDGQAPPPPGTPGYFYTMLKDGYPNHPDGVDRLAVYEFDVDWDTPANSTFTLADEIPISPFNYTVCGFLEWNCIPQPGTSMELDAFSEWPAWRLAYRNLGDYEAMVGNFTFDLNNSDHAAIRWFELRNTPSGWDLFQQGTHSPDGDHRFVGSIAMDGSGNIALGYSVSGTATDPSIRYATRLTTDPPGSLQDEQSLVEGAGIQTGFPFWGRSSAMTVDPSDECTFWFTAEYHDADNVGFDWNTRVGAFKIPSCSGGFEPDFTLSAGPGSLDVCSSNDAEFGVTVGSILGYSDPVTLSALGAPAGTSVSFSSNPVIPPGSSDLTIGNTGSAATGEYSIDVVGTGSSTTYTSTVTLNLFEPVGGSPSLITPANGAGSVPVQPSFSWGSVSQVDTYEIQVSLNSGFTAIVYSASELAGTTHIPGTALAEATTHFWRVRAVNACGNGNFSPAWSFTTVDLPPILLVDDDDDDPDVGGLWTAALNNLGLSYDILKTDEEDLEPDSATLANYETVLWFTGARFGAPGSGPAGPSPATETALADWLDGGGCFFISSQDYHADKGTTAFMTGYLGVTVVVDEDGGYTSVTGQNALAGFGPYNLSFPYDDSTDRLTVGNGGQAAVLGNNGHLAGVSKETVDYRTMYWAFGLETLPAGGRTAALEKILAWCAGDVPEPG
ncbi:MAG TPA: hypothetical protein VMN57_09495, partial [Anaerolineales bacterium]|nr:hypothetical protein [Anaerolineales bacterium]